jgi:ABC-type Zn2+ transport system substrate-binding protein/surface adhesin
MKDVRRRQEGHEGGADTDHPEDRPQDLTWLAGMMADEVADAVEIQMAQENASSRKTVFADKDSFNEQMGHFRKKRCFANNFRYGF